jgi:hypothetical protein
MCSLHVQEKLFESVLNAFELVEQVDCSWSDHNKSVQKVQRQCD